VNLFLAIVLVCPLAVSVEACSEAEAVDVLTIRVENEMGCAVGWQEIIARSAFREEIGRTTYVKTLCRRLRPAAQ
jgi:hypothetical protein